VDAGTTGATALVVEDDGQVVGRGYAEVPLTYPGDGLVEQAPAALWDGVRAAARDALAEARAGGASPPSALGLTNQRETAVTWDRETLTSPRPAIVWQDRRTAGICEQLRADGAEPGVTAATGLRLDPYFTATKLTWLARNEPRTWAGVLDGRLALGTVDSYLLARLTRGVLHATDATNASRTLLFDLRTATWSAELAELFGVPLSALPAVVPSYGAVGRTDPSAFLGLDLPIAGVAGDQQAALVGQAGFTPGSTKCTYGTGSFVLVATGTQPVHTEGGLLTTVALGHPDGHLDYALEGAVFVTGAAVQWLRDGLGLIDAASDVEALARSVPDAGGVVFVPALTGLGAPDWDPGARGLIIGITRSTTAAHLARATLDAIAFQVRDVVDLVRRQAGVDVPHLAVDGGAAVNDLLCQLQADQLGVPVRRAAVAESTALGAAYLAGLGTRVWSSPREVAALWRADATFEPGEADEAAHRRWRAAVERSKGWAGAARG